MVSLANNFNKLSFSERGQGALEAILALPVLLILVTAMIQFTLICMAQVLLQYAAYSAARTGLVGNFDLKEMKNTAGKILITLPGAVPSGGFSYEIQIRDEESEMTQVMVTWDFPLIVPLAGKLFQRNPFKRSLSGYPTFKLTSSWNIANQKVRYKVSNGK